VKMSNSRTKWGRKQIAQDEMISGVWSFLGFFQVSSSGFSSTGFTEELEVARGRLLRWGRYVVGQTVFAALTNGLTGL